MDQSQPVCSYSVLHSNKLPLANQLAETTNEMAAAEITLSSFFEKKTFAPALKTLFFIDKLSLLNQPT